MEFTGFKKLMCASLTALLLVISGTAEVKAEEWVEPTWTEEGSFDSWNIPAYNPYFGGYSNCTWSAWQIAYESTGIALPALGSAGSWLYNAAAMGYATGNVPAAGSIIVWSHHVGYVSEVSEDGSMIYIREGGYCGGYHEGWFPAYGARSWQSLIGYIYLW